MDNKQLIASLGIDYDEVMNRFANREDLYMKYLHKFCHDPGFQKLQNAIINKDYQEVEESSHMLKGTSANLGLKKFSSICNTIVLNARNRISWDVLELNLELIQKLYLDISEKLEKESKVVE